MITLRFQHLMTQGFGISNKVHFNELEEGEFDAWVSECRSLLSGCEPQPQGFPACPDYRHIQEIVFLLQKVMDEIAGDKTEYFGFM